MAAAETAGSAGTGLGCSLRNTFAGRPLLKYFSIQLRDQVAAIVPISVVMVVIIACIFRKDVADGGIVAGGVLSAIVGLLLFLEGIRVGFMPLGESIGRNIGSRLPQWAVLAVLGVIGILVTYAEPAMASLRPLARAVDPVAAPFLYYILNDMQEVLIFCVGLGVGIAAAVGTLRFVYNWRMLPMILSALIPTVALACYMAWGNTELRPLVGLAWDLGGVTTGPVTVPILLSAGVGFSKAVKQAVAAKKAAAAAEGENNGKRSPTEPVTLAVQTPTAPIKQHGSAAADAEGRSNSKPAVSIELVGVSTKAATANVDASANASANASASADGNADVLSPLDSPAATVGSMTSMTSIVLHVDATARAAGETSVGSGNTAAMSACSGAVGVASKQTSLADDVSTVVDEADLHLHLNQQTLGAGSVISDFQTQRSVSSSIFAPHGMELGASQQHLSAPGSVIGDGESVEFTSGSTMTIGRSCSMVFGAPDLPASEVAAASNASQAKGEDKVAKVTAISTDMTQAAKPSPTTAVEATTVPQPQPKREQPAEDSSLDGFGIVTLASLYPVLCVEILACIVGAKVDSRDIIDAWHARPADTAEKLEDMSPLREFIFAVRAVAPLAAGLMLIIVVLLRMPLPHVSFAVEQGSAQQEATQSREAVTCTDPGVMVAFPVLAPALESISRASDAETGASAAPTEQQPHRHAAQITTIEPAPTSPKASLSGRIARLFSKSPSTMTSASTPASAPNSPSWVQRTRAEFSRLKNMIYAVIMALVGMTLFNIGLTYAFTALADSAGGLLPGAFMLISDDTSSPHFQYAGGLALVLFLIFLIGFLATRAEPALNVLAATVEDMTRGAFKRSTLLYSVCVGVGAGMSIGCLKIIFSIPVAIFILAKYSIAVLLSFFSDDAFGAVAWDSAGVTTGPVTVPFVLSLGVGLGKALQVPEGFGILTCASVTPIITVLAVKLLVSTCRARARRGSNQP